MLLTIQSGRIKAWARPRLWIWPSVIVSFNNRLFLSGVDTGTCYRSSDQRMRLSQLEDPMKSLKYAIATTIVTGAIILAGCVTNPFVKGNKAHKTTATGSSGRTSASLMDSQEAQLRESLNRTGVDITRNGHSIHLNMPGHLTFASGSHKIKPGFHEVLNSLAGILNEYRDTRINVYGHTDSVGKQSYNQKLSTIRARRVASYLAAKGIGSDRFTVEGLGDSKPIASNKTKYGRAKNRRVEIEILPVK